MVLMFLFVTVYAVTYSAEVTIDGKKIKLPMITFSEQQLVDGIIIIIEYNVTTGVITFTRDGDHPAEPGIAIQVIHYMDEAEQAPVNYSIQNGGTIVSSPSSVP